MRIFLAGIMQGSHLAEVLHHQGYRARLQELLRRHVPGSEIYDPLADHQDSLQYDDQRGRAVFWGHNQLCRNVDVLVAYVPEASMGTAIEMWETYQHGGFVVAISPLVHNWVIRFCSHEVFTDLDAFEAALADGDLSRRIRQHVGVSAPAECGDSGKVPQRRPGRRA